MRIKIITIISGFVAVIAMGTLFAAVLPVNRPSVVVMAGQTIEIPLSSDIPIASDLTANGEFQAGDVTFTAGPGCHLSHNGCTLLVTAAPTSKDYTKVPVVVSASAATNTATFMLSVIHAKEPVLSNARLPQLVLTPRPPSNHSINVVATVPTTAVSSVADDHTAALLQRSGNALFYGVAEVHPSSAARLKDTNTDFTSMTNGPRYQVVRITNNDVTQPITVTLSGDGDGGFSFDDNTADYGSTQNCAALTTTLASNDSCVVIMKGAIGDPNQAPLKATLTIRGNDNNIATFTLTDTTYIYAAGGFNTLGNASVSGGDLLAQCTAGTCSNALQGTTGNNYASTNFSVGQWINALSVTPAGNLMVGGVFGAIGGATSGAISGTAALLAQCTPGSKTGNACINQINGASNNYAFNNAYIDAVTAPFAISSNNFMAVGGDFTQIRGFTTTGQMLAKCQYIGTSPSATCNTYLGATVKYANKAISALDTLGSTSSVPLVNAGGLFTQIAGYPTEPPSSGTTFASCTTSVSACSKSMSSNNANSSILGMTDDGTYLYMGGTFTQIGGYVDSSGGYPLVTCTPGTTTTCANALAASNDANGYIEGLVYSGGSLYVGGRFTTIGGATPVSGGNMLATCSPGGSCTNIVTDTNPYASGTDWGGMISAVAVGNQTSISAN